LSEPTAIRAAGVVIALASEARTLAPHNVQPDRITPLAGGSALYLSGMGPAAAHRAAHALADAGAVALAVFGVAGALDKTLRNGSLCCPERILDEDGHAYTVDNAWHARLRQALLATQLPLCASGSLLSVQTPLLTAADKQSAHTRFDALAVDMESAAVAAVAHERKLPFVVLRAIVDEAADAIPTALNNSIDAWGRPQTLRLLAALCRHPSVLADLPRLYSRMQRATQALHAAAKAAGPSLAWSA
jgi:adenosylhomocysteine nucleosidase